MEPLSVLLLLYYAACSIGAAVILNTTAPTVDLGYEIYTGYYNQSANLNIFKGIRYAAPPTRELRWQKPHAPALNRSQIISATDYPPRCPQSPNAPLPEGYNFTKSGLGNEDCLFLSVFARPGARGLPVMVWIHGGGYGTGQGNNEFWELLNTNTNDFILVLIQYRLGAFGFLSSKDMVSHGGTPNAGLYDIHFSLEWVQNHIEAFGGDNQRVTISGESAGAGAVMLMTMADGGGEGTSLFTNAIVASPYLPMQWNYDGLEPTQAYYRLAKEVECSDEEGRSFPDQAVFECLLTMDSSTLQNASAHISGGPGGLYGQWAFLPVTDGAFLRERPSAQLASRKVNGLRTLSGNNANEGAGFVPQNITDASDFDEYLRILFPLMSSRDLDRLDKAYRIPPQIPGPLFSTLGSVGPTALNQSEYAIGQQQRANNLYAETTLVCPSYWLASAYSGSSSNDRGKTFAKQAWKYQFSVPPSEHGADLDAYQAFNRETLGEGTMNMAARKAVQLAWGRFIIYDDPTLPAGVVKSLTTTSNGSSTGDEIYEMMTGAWPIWLDTSVEDGGYQMLNINLTGGTPETLSYTFRDGTIINLTQMTEPGLKASFQIVDAFFWEAGRGRRCELWKDLGASVPE